MDHILAHMSRMHALLQDTYDVDRVISEFDIDTLTGHGGCRGIAEFFNMQFQSAGRSSHVVRFGDRLESYTGKASRNLRPLPYHHHDTEWMRHYVCIFDEQAIDPVFSSPIHVDDYSHIMFGKHVPFESA